MTVAQACSQIVEILEEEKENAGKNDENESESSPATRASNQDAMDHNTLCVGLARVGKDDQTIRVDTLANMTQFDLGPPLHSLIIVGRIHPMEAEYLKMFYKMDDSKTSFQDLVDSHNKYYK